MSERQARRLANKLPESDRSLAHIRPARVRWSPAVSIQMTGGVTSRPAMSGDVHSSMSLHDHSEAGQASTHPQNSPINVESCPATSGDIRQESPAVSNDVALLDHLQAEVEFLRSELTKSREEAAKAESEMRVIMLSDRQELSRLRQQLAITEKKPETVETAKRDHEQPLPWWGRIFRGKG